ncbi:HAD-IIA family hydrolase [bacterium]|nr:HAD-IIA family hydrolase [bacterium]
MLHSKKLIFDIDGTLYIDGKLLDGAKELIAFLNRESIPFVLVTNTTSLTARNIQKMLADAGLEIELSHIITPVKSAISLFKSAKYKRIAIHSCSAIHSEFSEFTITDENPDAILLADDGSGLKYDDITAVLKNALRNTPLFTLQQNKFYSRNGEMVADLGFYVAGVEYITGKTVTNCGKPSQAILTLAQEVLQAKSFSEMAIVGDDLEFDILGAQKHGLTGVLIKTGKYLPGIEDNFAKKAHLTISSLYDLITKL